MKISWNAKIPVVIQLISILYEFCSSGGLCHIVTDDGNIRDSDLEYVIEHCKKNPDDVDAELSNLICSLMLKMTINQRAGIMTAIDTNIGIYDVYDWERFTEGYEGLIKELIDTQCEE